MTNHDLDDLFKRGSEQYDFTYRADAWTQMESLLDQQQKRRRGLWWLVALIGLVVVGVGGYYLVQSLNATPPASLPQARTIPTAPLDQLPTLPDESNEKSTQLLSAHADTLDSNSSAAFVPGTGTSIVDATGLTIEKPAAAFAEKARPGRNDTESSSETTAMTPHTAIGSTTDDTTPSYDQRRPDYLPLTVPTLTFAVVDGPARENSTIALATPITVEAPSHKTPAAARWSAGLGFAREWNTVRFGTTLPGWKAGALLEYRIGRSLSIGTGITYSDKDYLAGPGEYKASTQAWVDDIAPRSTLAECAIVEIPLRVSYYNAGWKQSGWYGTLGVQSFFINRETFTFYYDDPPVGALTNWEERGTNNHLLGVLQTEAGYLWQLGDKIGLQLAPYLQLPITGIGHGKVNLTSFGIRTQVRFF